MVVTIFPPLANTNMVANISNCLLEPHLETIVHLNKEGKFLVDANRTRTTGGFRMTRSDDMNIPCSS
jgi:hypothetical protein